MIRLVRMVRETLSRYRAIRNGDKIARLLSPAFFFFLGPQGKMDERMQADEFIISYMYGYFGFMMTNGLGITDDAEKVITLVACYDRFFPGEGKRLVALCTSRVEAGNEPFIRGATKAVEEMTQAELAIAGTSNPDDEKTVLREIDKSGADIAWPSLRKHLLRNYVAPGRHTET
jgi:hypothetical protein